MKGKQWQLAHGPLVLMQQSGLGLDVIAYCAAVSACEKGAQWQQALGLLAERLQSGVVPMVFDHYSAVSA
jgi:pentatricopeptide repeat domain-containing protein 1